MPYVSVRLAGEISDEQRAKIAQGITEVLVREAGKSPETVLITIEDLPRKKWARGGKLLEG